MFAAEIRRRRVHHRTFSLWRWHLDEIFVRINGETHYLWRAVDHEGEVLEVLVTKRRDRGAALPFLRKAMKRYGRPEMVVTDRLRSYRAPGDRSLAEQSGRKFASAVPATRASDGENQERQISTEIRLNPRFGPRPF